MRALLLSLALAGCASVPATPPLSQTEPLALETPIQLPAIPQAEHTEAFGTPYFIFTADAAIALADFQDAAIALEQQCIDIFGAAMSCDTESQALRNAMAAQLDAAAARERALKLEVWGWRIGLAGLLVLGVSYGGH